MSAAPPQELRRPRVRFGSVEGAVLISSDDFLVARVPPGASSGPVVVSTNGHASNPHEIRVAAPIAENLHPVTSPALDAEGNIYVTFSGSRGQKVQVAIYKIDTNYNVKPFLGDMMNATAIAFDRSGQMYVSSRHDGTVYRVAPNSTMSTYAEGMGVPHDGMRALELWYASADQGNEEARRYLNGIPWYWHARYKIAALWPK